MAQGSRDPSTVTVVVVRHGPAEDRDPVRWPNDDRRPLTRKGRAQTRRAARALARLTRPIDRLASSAAVRAVSTAEIVRESLDTAPERETWPELAPGNMAEPLFEKVRRTTRTKKGVLVVGHDPTLAEFVGMALTGDGHQVVELTKGGAACLEFPAGVRPGTGRLLWLLTRKQLAAERA